MKKCKEYCDNIYEYFGWLKMPPNDMLDKISVISYNASGVTVNKEEFGYYCEKEIQADLQSNKHIYAYMVATERLVNVNSRIEIYKRCWKKLSNVFDLSFMQLSDDIEYKINEATFYSGIARADFSHLADIVKIIDSKQNYYTLFISDKDYLKQIYKGERHLAEFVNLNDSGEIDYEKLIKMCNKNQDLACRYGIDSISCELAFLFNHNNLINYFSKQAIDNFIKK